MKKFIVGIILIAMLLSIAGCGAQNSDNGTSSSEGSSSGSNSVSGSETADTVIFTDSTDRDVEVPSEITAISPAGRVAQLFLMVLAPEKLASLSDLPSSFTEIEGIVGDYLLELPHLGRIYGDEGINSEELAKINPQIIIDIGETKDSVADDLSDLTTQTLIPAVHIESNSQNAAEVFRSLGKLLGMEERAEQLALYCEQTDKEIADIMEEVGDDKVNLIYSLGTEGQNVIAYDSYHSEIIDLMSNNLAVVDLPSSQGTGNEVNIEQLITWNPDYIIFEQQTAYDHASEDSLWGQISAIENGNFFKAPDVPYNWLGNPPSVNRYIGMWWTAKIFYPTYADYDLREKVDEYYELFYGCDLTDEQYNALMENSLPK